MSSTLNSHSLPDIMHYESDIWAIADLLLSAGIKQSDFPAYMMPFFALVMLEGRMLNEVSKVELEEHLTAQSDPDEFKQAFLERGCGYNVFIVMEGKTLRKICSNDKTFEQDFASYLAGFDADLKELLGIGRGLSDKKYLNMDGIVAELRGKGILMNVVTQWAAIDLSRYDNSAITTLEEHIKRRWADISASTAGEQYTPDDVISLIAEIVAAKISKPKNKYVHIYDPTCGGANLLFGVADRLQAHGGYHQIATYGSEYNDALYALAAIESRFRDHSTIKYGNTLTNIPFHGTPFDVIVANPPYGTKWSGFEKEIRKDQAKQFAGGIPAVSDGQLLFMQHILWQLDSMGLAVEVHNGSALFSGDAGSGESNIRKYIFDRDWVEAIIQLPQQEFFNTGIYTYIWVMNKNKPENRKNRVALIEASNGWQPLKKSKGDKRREMGQKHREAILDALMRFEDNDICKIFSREHFYYNKQSLVLTELSVSGHSVLETICPDGKTHVLSKAQAIKLGDEPYRELEDIPMSDARTMGKRISEQKTQLAIAVRMADDEEYVFDVERQTIIHKLHGTETDLGMGVLAFKVSQTKKGTSWKISIEPFTQNDYEIIPHHFDEQENKREIDAFMQRYVVKPYRLTKNVVGVEINFNKEFYVPESLDNVDDILHDIQK